MRLSLKTPIILLILVQINFLNSQVSENFDEWSDGSYGSTSSYGEWVSNNAITNSTNARSGKAVRLRNNSSSYLEYVGSDGNGKDGGVGEISFWYRSWDSSPTAVYNIEASIDGSSYSTIGSQISTSSTTYAKWSFNLDNSSDNIKIKISNVSGERLHIDDFSIENFGTASSPGITLGSVSGNTTEGGDSASFTVVLDSAPTSDVSLNISSSDENEVTVNPSILNFTSSDWETPVTVILSGVDDSIIDADAEVTITVSVDDDNSDDSYDGISESTTVVNENNDFPDTPDLIITEVADPNGTGGDKKRYVEIFNNSDSSIDLSDYKLKKFTGGSANNAETTMSGTLQTGEFYIIASSASDFKSVYGFSADKSTSNVISGNGDDSYAITTASTGFIVDLYGDITQSGSSYADGSGTAWEYEDGRAERISTSTAASSTWTSSDWNVHNDSGGGDGPQTAPTDYDPGYWIGATSQDTWNGLSNSDWAIDGNWASGSVPITTDNVFILEATNNPQIGSTSIEINSLKIKGIGAITATSSSQLSLIGDFFNSEGSLTLSSSATDYASLVVGGTATGNITYNRYIDVDRWYITSSPVSGQDIDSFILNEDLAVSTNNTSIIGLADYNNDGSQYAADSAITTGWWDYHQAGDDGSFTAGKGKIVRLASDATDNLLSFTGGINNGTLTVPITSNTTAFNLVGNPYTASIAVNSVADATNNVLTVNSALLSEQTAWFWNGSSSAYVAVNQNPSQAAKFAPPGQGFFISSATGGGNLSFTNAMQTISTTASFNRQTEFSKIDLSMSADGQTSATEIVYFEGATTGWDNGYDSTNFSSAAFQLFTDHVDNAWDDNLSIQSLPPNNYDNMVVPVGVNASAGQSIAISIGTTNWPEGVNVYLEDTDDNSFTLLDANTAFTTLLDSDENGIGRFYIHTTSNSLGDGDLTLTDVVIYTPSKDILRILGLSSGPANVQMFDLMGKQVLNTSFNGQSVNDVKLPNLNTGVYLVTLVSDEGTVNKKLIIQ